MTYDELHKQLDEEYDRIIAETLRQLAKKKLLTRQKLAKALFEANKRYWTARLALLDDSAVYDAERIGRIVGTAYSNAAIELSDQVRRVFSGYQSAFNLTRKGAEDLLEHVVYDRSIADNLRTMAAAVPDSEEKARIMAELSAPAYRYRMQRAEQIAKNAQETLESIAKFEVRTDRAFMQTEIEKAYNISLDEAQRLPPSDAVIIDLSGQSPQNTGYMPRAEEPVRDFTPTTDRGIMDSFTLVNDKAVKEIIDHEWEDGNFSERIWSNTDELAREVKQVLLEGELTGASEAKMAAKIEERFQVGMHKARRVIRTESNYCINQSELKGMKDAGFDEYEFISLGEEAEDVCDTCDDLDGQRFKIADATVGVNCPPMHPFCRCKVTTPQETLEDIQADIDRMLSETSIEEIEQRLDMMIEEREALPESDSTLDSAEDNSQKTLTTDNSSDIIKAIENVEQSNDVISASTDTNEKKIVEGNSQDYLSQTDITDISQVDSNLYPETLAGVKRGEAMSFEEADTGNVNPHYGEKGFDKNCQSCTIVYEARRRGFDVETLPCLPGSMAERLANQYTLAWIDPKTGKRPDFIKDNTKDSPKKYLDYMKKTIKPNERYILGFSWKGKGNSGHIVNLDLNPNGELRIKDNQRGKRERSEYVGDKAVLGYLKQMKWSESFSGYKMPKVPKMLRIDNLQFEPDVAKKIMKGRVK